MGSGVSVGIESARAAPRSQRKAKGDGHLRRTEILAAAQKIFVECGYEGATIRRIADEVGVSSTALYMHFRDKSEILVEICSDTFSHIIASNAGLAARDMDPVARVREMLEAYMQFGLDNPHAYQLVLGPSTTEIPPDKLSILTELGAKNFKLFSGAIEQIRDAGRLRNNDVDAVAQVLWAGPHGLINLLINHPNFNWTDRDALVKLMLDGLFAGLIK